jgi:uncharacterized caspase-like protein
MAKFALLVGVSDYEPGLNPLPSALKDIEAMQRVLQNPQVGGFDKVKILTNPDSHTMQYEIEMLFSACSKSDLVLLFFSGHGVKDDSGRLYFATRITRKNQKGDLIRSTTVPASFIHEAMNECKAKRQVFILDCCFSGAFDPSLRLKDDNSVDFQTQLGSEGRVVLTSSSSTQYSFEQQGLDLSVYTLYLVEGMASGAADLNKDGEISVLELHDYAACQLQQTAPYMTPKLITLKDKGFDIMLAKSSIHKQATNSELKIADVNKSEHKQRQLEQQKERQDELQRRQDLHRTSVLKARFSKLSQLLRSQEWQEADTETWSLMFEAVNYDYEVFLSVQAFKSFPCKTISEVDDLWLKASNGRFGFSIQKQIFHQAEREAAKSSGWVSRQTIFSQKLKLSSVPFGAGSDYKLDLANCPIGYFPRRGKSNQYDHRIGWIFDWQNDFWVENFEMMHARLLDCAI